MDKKINMSIDEGKPFFAHEASVNFSPTQFILDFRCITPRVDPRSNEHPTLNILHNVVMLDAFHTKKMHELLGKMIEKYETEFGNIKKPESIKKVEKKQNKKQKTISETPNYFG